MSASSIFQICSAIASLGWVILIFFPKWYSADKFIIGIIVTLLSIIYSWMIWSSFNMSIFQKFGKLESVMQLFQNEKMVTAGWVHYLAFDLMAGVFIRKNAMLHGISHWLLVIPLFFTFVFGPFGLLLYLIVRLIIIRKYFVEN